jgi:hypothetical protein
MSLQSDNTVNFFYLDKYKRASWWDKEIIDLNSKDGGYSSDGLLACAAIFNIHCCSAFAHIKKGNDAMINIDAATAS